MISFLEPACGKGNFLAEILEYKLNVFENHYGKSQLDYECYATLYSSQPPLSLPRNAPPRLQPAGRKPVLTLIITENGCKICCTEEHAQGKTKPLDCCFLDVLDE